MKSFKQEKIAIIGLVILSLVLLFVFSSLQSPVSSLIPVAHAQCVDTSGNPESCGGDSSVDQLINPTGAPAYTPSPIAPTTQSPNTTPQNGGPANITPQNGGPSNTTPQNGGPANITPQNGGPSNTTVQNGGLSSSPTSGGFFYLQNPLSSNFNSVGGIVQGFLQILSYLAVLAGVFMLVWTGMQFVLAQGEPQRLTELKRQLLYIVIGLAIVIGATIIVNVVINTLQATGTVNSNIIQSAKSAASGQ